MLLDDNFKMQGGVRNYLGKTQEVTAPKFWKSSKDSPSTELVYITEAEKGLLADANLHGSLKNGKPNVGASGLLSYDGWGDASDGFGSSGSSSGGSSSGGSSSGGGGGNDNSNDYTGSDYGFVVSQPTTTPPSNNNNDSGNSYTVPNPTLPPGVAPVSTYDEAGITMGDIDAEDEYLAPDPNHFKATQKAIGKTQQELNELGLNKSDWTDYTTEEQDAYQAEMNRLNGTEGKNYSFYKGNKGTTNLTFGEHFKDVVVTDPFLKVAPTLRFLVAAGRTIKENLTTDYGTGNYGGYTGDGMGSGQPIDKGGWIGRIFNSDGSVNQNLTEQETNDLYNQAQVELPNIISNTTPQDSMVNKYFDNMLMTQGSPLSSDLQISYNNAKNSVNNILGITPPSQQFGYSAQPYGLLSSTNMADNPYNIDYLKQRGLI
jgi:hypothetical protein